MVTTPPHLENGCFAACARDPVQSVPTIQFKDSWLSELEVRLGGIATAQQRQPGGN